MGGLIPSTESHAFELAPRLRKEDAEEIRANSGIPPYFALLIGVRNSTPAVSLVNAHGHLLGMAGVVPTAEPDRGAVWMLAADQITDHSIEFLRKSKQWVNEVNDLYPILHNVVDARNTTHISWLKWLGFSFLRLIPEYGAGRLPFYEFARIQDV